MKLIMFNSTFKKKMLSVLRYVVLFALLSVIGVIIFIKQTNYPMMDIQYLLNFQYGLVCLKRLIDCSLFLLYLYGCFYLLEYKFIFSWSTFFFIINGVLFIIMAFILLPSISLYNCLCIYGQFLYLAIEYEPSLKSSAQEFLNVFMDNKGTMSTEEEARKKLQGKIASVDYDPEEKKMIACIDLERLKNGVANAFIGQPSEDLGQYENGKRVAKNYIVDQGYEYVRSSLGLLNALCKVVYEKDPKK